MNFYDSHIFMCLYATSLNVLFVVSIYCLFKLFIMTMFCLMYTIRAWRAGAFGGEEEEVTDFEARIRRLRRKDIRSMRNDKSGAPLNPRSDECMV